MENIVILERASKKAFKRLLDGGLDPDNIVYASILYDMKEIKSENDEEELEKFPLKLICADCSKIYIYFAVAGMDCPSSRNTIEILKMSGFVFNQEEILQSVSLVFC